MQRHIRLQKFPHILHDFRQPRNHLGRRGFCQYGLQEFLLPPQAADVPFVIPITHVRHSPSSIQMLPARIEINDETAVFLPRIFVIHPLFHVDIHPAYGVHRPSDRLQIGDQIIIHRCSQKFLHRLLRQHLAAESVRVVDLIVALPLDRRPRIRGKGQDCASLFLRIHHGQKESISPPGVVFPRIYPHHHDLFHRARGHPVLRSSRWRGTIRGPDPYADSHQQKQCQIHQPPITAPLPQSLSPHAAAPFRFIRRFFQYSKKKCRQQRAATALSPKDSPCPRSPFSSKVPFPALFWQNPSDACCRPANHVIMKRT